jgi:hypothetical protein
MTIMINAGFHQISDKSLLAECLLVSVGLCSTELFKPGKIQPLLRCNCFLEIASQI